jgi:hypothetical protein
VDGSTTFSCLKATSQFIAFDGCGDLEVKVLVCFGMVATGVVLVKESNVLDVPSMGGFVDLAS